MKLLPQTKVPILRLVVIGLAIGCVCLAILYFRQSVVSQLKLGIVSLVLLIPLAVGLWLLMPWARVVTILILWFIVFTVPFIVVSPWAVIDSLNPHSLPVWEVLMYHVVPLVIPAVFSIEMLYGYKNEFQWPRDTAVTANGSTPSPGAMLPRSWSLWCLAVIGTPALFTSLMNFDIRLEGGCIPLVTNNQPVFRPLWVILPVVCVMLGLIVFLRADYAGATRQRKIVRALIYVAGMYLLCTEILSYVEVTRIC